MTQITIIAFGQLTDITGNRFTIDNIIDTNTLKIQLEEQYPLLKNRKYAIAVDEQIVSENTLLNASSTVALLPPFSGG